VLSDYVAVTLQINGKIEELSGRMDGDCDELWEYQITDRSDCYTLLQYAAGNGHSEAVTVLIAHSQNLTQINLPSYRRGHTALYLAAASG
jgi:hypothetical protein